MKCVSPFQEVNGDVHSRSQDAVISARSLEKHSNDRHTKYFTANAWVSDDRAANVSCADGWARRK